MHRLNLPNFLYKPTPQDVWNMHQSHRKTKLKGYTTENIETKARKREKTFTTQLTLCTNNN